MHQKAFTIWTLPIDKTLAVERPRLHSIRIPRVTWSQMLPEYAGMIWIYPNGRMTEAHTMGRRFA